MQQFAAFVPFTYSPSVLRQLERHRVLQVAWHSDDEPLFRGKFQDSLTDSFTRSLCVCVSVCLSACVHSILENIRFVYNPSFVCRASISDQKAASHTHLTCPFGSSDDLGGLLHTL